MKYIDHTTDPLPFFKLDDFELPRTGIDSY